MSSRIAKAMQNYQKEKYEQTKKTKKVKKIKKSKDNEESDEKKFTVKDVTKTPIIRVRIWIYYHDDDSDIGDIITFLNQEIPKIELPDYEIKHLFVVEQKDDIEDTKVLFSLSLKGKEKDLVELLMDNLKLITHPSFTSDVKVNLIKQFITTDK